MQEPTDQRKWGRLAAPARTRMIPPYLADRPRDNSAMRVFAPIRDTIIDGFEQSPIHTGPFMVGLKESRKRTTLAALSSGVASVADQTPPFGAGRWPGGIPAVLQAGRQDNNRAVCHTTHLLSLRGVAGNRDHRLHPMTRGKGGGGRTRTDRARLVRAIPGKPATPI
jgi:hypothetical protein